MSKSTDHVFEPHRDVCFVCGRTRQQIVDQRVLRCDGTPQYREWIKGGMTFVREPIVRHDG